MAERIYIRGEGGKLEPLQEEPFSTEDELQALLAEHPELLDGEQMQPDHPRRWVLISREMGIPEEPDESARWFVDHLIVDQDARPTLVECKRRVDSATRRTIVGQMLEYAAHASESWTADRMRECFEAHCEDRGLAPTAKLAYLLGTDDADLDGFFQVVARNLAARRMRLLFVADKLPDPLLRVVEFLNQQMRDVQVLGVEIKLFRGNAGQTLVPRVMGRIAGIPKPGTRRAPLTRKSFLDQFSDEEVREAAAKLLGVVTRTELGWGEHHRVTVRAHCPSRHRYISIAWLYTPQMESSGGFGTNFTFGALNSDLGQDKELRAVLERWVGGFEKDPFTTRASSNEVTAWSVGHEAAVQHIDLLADRLSKVLEDLKQL